MSPSKTMTQESLIPFPTFTQTLFEKKTKQILDILKNKYTNDLVKLLSVNYKIASLNAERYLNFKSNPTLNDSLQAIFSYKGEVYSGLGSNSFQTEDLYFAQNHLRILSGFYGYLRPLDIIQPHRLEMATKINIGKYDNLYAFWRREVNEAMYNELKTHPDKLIINLASNEYSRLIDLNNIDYKVVTPVFLDSNNGKLKVISVYAKKARGHMASFIIKNRITKTEQLNTFNEDGYIYNVKLSPDDSPHFTR